MVASENDIDSFKVRHDVLHRVKSHTQRIMALIDENGYGVRNVSDWEQQSNVSKIDTKYIGTRWRKCRVSQNHGNHLRLSYLP